MADDPEKQDEFYSDDTGFLLGVTGKQKGEKTEAQSEWHDN